MDGAACDGREEKKEGRLGVWPTVCHPQRVEVRLQPLSWPAWTDYNRSP